jgi:hypothetical protein
MPGISSTARSISRISRNTPIGKSRSKIALENKTVDFEVPELSNVTPAPGMMREDETYIGPIWDPVFPPLQDRENVSVSAERQPEDQYEPSQFSPAVTVGMRTSFAFYKDKITDRQILDQPPLIGID